MAGDAQRDFQAWLEELKRKNAAAPGQPQKRYSEPYGLARQKSAEDAAETGGPGRAAPRPIAASGLGGLEELVNTVMAAGRPVIQVSQPTEEAQAAKLARKKAELRRRQQAAEERLRLENQARAAAESASGQAVRSGPTSAPMRAAGGRKPAAHPSGGLRPMPLELGAALAALRQDRTALRQAFVMAELLAAPKALRPMDEWTL